MKKTASRIVKIISIILPIFLILSFCQDYLFRLNKKPTWRAKGFYLENDNSIDVALMGASEIFAGYAAGLAYKEYKFTSYPWAYDDAPVSLWKSQLNEILKSQNPKMVFIEVNGALIDGEEYLYDDGAIRRYLDNIPLSINKIQTVSSLKLKDNLLTYYFPFIKYHGNYLDAPKVFKENLYYDTQGYSLLKGFQTKTKFEDDYQLYSIDEDRMLPVATPSQKYLVEFLEFCKEKRLNVIFSRFPHRITDEKSANKYYRCQSLKRMVEEYGFEFWDLESCHEEIGIDYIEDFYDNEHLNIFGAKKMTLYLGGLLATKYGIKNHVMNDAEANNWQLCAEYTDKFFNYVEKKHNEGIDESIGEKSSLIKELRKNY